MHLHKRNDLDLLALHGIGGGNDGLILAVTIVPFLSSELNLLILHVVGDGSSRKFDIERSLDV